MALKFCPKYKCPKFLVFNVCSLSKMKEEDAWNLLDWAGMLKKRIESSSLKQQEYRSIVNLIFSSRVFVGLCVWSHQRIVMSLRVKFTHHYKYSNIIPLSIVT